MTSEQADLRVSMEIQDYWHETITKEEAVRRLNSRELDAATRAEIESEIPQQTEHYVTFNHGAFREYIEFPDGTSMMLLLLPAFASEDGAKYKLATPVFTSNADPSGSSRSQIGFEIHEYEDRDGALYEDGQLVPPLQFHRGPRKIDLDVTFIVSQTSHAQGITRGACCRACEWVHSIFRIHSVDRICCAGGCQGLPHFDAVFA